ncbi:peptidylprolyl isomerase [Roseiterribacter gracilis]|uniref:Parvulin-like PPIase n=1 Tax=Roseiterribacter gracilis TaxID=2812848 RepID=A0A8S8X666_9PROT|nr:rotamase [Rhodospirillales bacterium TMPK1]
MLQAFRGAAGSLVVKVLFGLLLVSFLFFGVSDVLRNRGLDQNVATVGGDKIATVDLDREFRRELERVRRATGGGAFDAATAKRLGLLDQTLERMIDDRVLLRAAQDAGLVVGDAQAVQLIRQQQAFVDPTTKQFDRFRMIQMLQQAGFTEQSFVEATKRDLTTGLLLDAMAGGPAAPGLLVDDLYRARAERRVAETLTIKNDSATGIAEPTDAQLTEYHQAHAVAFTRPELRTLTSLVLTPDSFLGQIEVSDEDLKGAYEARRTEFVKPERRKVEQVVLSDKAQADALLAAAKGKSLADAAKQLKAPAPVTIDAAAKEELPDVLQAPVFDAAKNVVAGPVQSALGYHVFVVTDIAPGGEIPFDQAKAKLLDETKRERAADRLIEQSQKLDDRLAGGASLDEIANTVGATPVKVGPVDAQGRGADGKPVANVAPDLLRTGFGLKQGETSNLVESGDARYIVVRADTVTPAVLKPLAEVKAEVVAAWKGEQRAEATRKKASALVEKANAGATLASLSKEAGSTLVTTQPFDRAGLLANAAPTAAPVVPREIVAKLFDSKAGVVTSADTADGVVIARLTGIVPADLAQAGPQLAQAKQEVERSIANDRAALFIKALRARYPVEIDRIALDRMYGANAE